MNVGAIFGVVEPINNAFVRFDGVWTGHVNNQLNVFNIKSGLANNLGLITPDKNNFFVIPFHWEEHDVGDFMMSRFRVAAFDTVENRFAVHEGNLHVGRNPASEWESAVDEIDGLLALADFPLASAIKTVFTPRLSSDNMAAVGAAHLVIEF